eukprot:TRINITY_DN295_c0_g1_i3.p1 TRINITY_DN295_c0_g1~~TRINITY_DN295_c0_g1_i3.p1  ORF type:complete len:306 (+),score=85.38 TRINITY_DN295_c0_g1_i3:63-920(+)
MALAKLSHLAAKATAAAIRRYRPCTLLEREVLTDADSERGIPEVQRLRFSLPSGYTGTLGYTQPLVHVKVRRPDSWFRARTYSLTSPANTPGAFELTVKIYPGTGVSAHLGSLPIGEQAHVARTLTKRLAIPGPPGVGDELPASPTVPKMNVGIIAFGVGITECVITAEDMLRAGHTVRLLYGNRHESQVLFKDALERVQSEYPSTFRVHHRLSREDCDDSGDCSRGRIDAKALEQQFGEWDRASSYFLVVGTKQMAAQAWSELRSLGHTQKLLLPARPWEIARL